MAMRHVSESRARQVEDKRRSEMAHTRNPSFHPSQRSVSETDELDTELGGVAASDKAEHWLV